MKINPINDQNFEAKKFRIPVKTEFVRKDNIVHETRMIVKEFSNPKAKVLWNKALEENNLSKKMKYLNAMGEYKLVDINQGKDVLSAIKKLNS